MHDSGYSAGSNASNESTLSSCSGICEWFSTSESGIKRTIQEKGAMKSSAVNSVQLGKLALAALAVQIIVRTETEGVRAGFWTSMCPRLGVCYATE